MRLAPWPLPYRTPLIGQLRTRLMQMTYGGAGPERGEPAIPSVPQPWSLGFVFVNGNRIFKSCHRLVRSDLTGSQAAVDGVTLRLLAWAQSLIASVHAPAWSLPFVDEPLVSIVFSALPFRDLR